MDDGSPVDPDPQTQKPEPSDSSTKSPGTSKTEQAVAGSEQTTTKKSKKSRRKKKGKKKSAETVTMEAEATQQPAAQEVTPETSDQPAADVGRVTEGQSLEETSTSTDQDAATEEEKAEGQGEGVGRLAEGGEEVTEEVEVAASGEGEEAATEAAKATEPKDEAPTDGTAQGVPTIEVTQVKTPESEEEKPEGGVPEAYTAPGDQDAPEQREVMRAEGTKVDPQDLHVVAAPGPERHLGEEQRAMPKTKDGQQVPEQQLANVGIMPGLQDISLTSTDSSLEGIFRQDVGRTSGMSFQVIKDDSFEKSQGIFPISDLSNYYDIPEKLHTLEVDLAVNEQQAAADRLPAAAAAPEETPAARAAAEAVAAGDECAEVTSPRSLIGDVIEPNQSLEYDDSEKLPTEEPGSENTDDVIGDVIEHNFSQSSAESTIRDATERTATTTSGAVTPTGRARHVAEHGGIMQSVTGEQISVPSDDGDKESMTTDDMLAPDFIAPQEDVSTPTYTPKVSKSYSYAPVPVGDIGQTKDDQSTISDIIDFYGEDRNLGEMESFSDYISDWRKETDISKPEKKLRLSKPDDISYGKSLDGAEKRRLFQKTAAADLPKRIPTEGLAYNVNGRAGHGKEPVPTYSVYPKYEERTAPEGDLQFRVYKKYDASEKYKELKARQDYCNRLQQYMSEAWRQDVQSENAEDAPPTDKEILAYSYRTQKQLDLVGKDDRSQRDAGYDRSLNASTPEAGIEAGQEVPRKKSAKVRELDNILQDAMDNAFKEETLKPYQPSVEDNVDVYADLMPRDQLDELVPIKVATKSTAPKTTRQTPTKESVADPKQKSKSTGQRPRLNDSSDC